MQDHDTIHCEFCQWLLENEDDIRSGGAQFGNHVITPQTEAVCFRSVVSIVFSTLIFETTHKLKSENPSSLVP